MARFALTPGGYKPLDNVHEVPAGTVVRPDGDHLVAVAPDGLVVRRVPAPEPKDPGRPLLPHVMSPSLAELAAQGHEVVQADRVSPAADLLARLRATGPVVPRRARLDLGRNGTGSVRIEHERVAGGLSDLLAQRRRTLGQVRTGRGAAAAVVPAASVDGWVCNTGWTNTTGTPLQTMSTTWRVPPEPTARDDQTVFLFNGIQNSTMIYQPVLQWGSSAAGGGKRWSVASWYADGPTGVSFHSPLVDVSAGDLLTGVMTLTGQSNGLCDYVCEFVGMPGTRLVTSQVQELTWANVTLEAYGVTKRDHYPATGRTAMVGIDLRVGAPGSPPSAPVMTWTPDNQTDVAGEHVDVRTDGATDGAVDLWYTTEVGVGGWSARHGLDPSGFQGLFDDLVGSQEMRLVCVSGYEEAGTARHVAIWRKDAHPVSWLARHGVDSAGHQNLVDTLPAQGWYPVLVNGCTVRGTDLYASIWHRDDAPAAWVARHGLSGADYQAAFDTFAAQGYVLVWVSGYGDGRTARFAALWHRRDGWAPAWSARHGQSATDYQATFEQLTAAGQHPVVVSGYRENGADRYACVFTNDPVGTLDCRHGLDPQAYQAEFDTMAGQAYHPRFCDAWQGQDGTRFNVVFESD